MKSFKTYLDERSSKIDRSLQDFHINVPGHGMMLIKARSEDEAHSKARAKLQKGDDRSDTFKEAYRKPTEAEIKKDKERENAGKKRPSMDHKSVSKKMYGNMMGGLKEEEQIDEILDTPKAMTSYKNKAKASYDKAASSAAAKILRGKDKDGNRADHRPELKTMAKRKKGMTAADMVAVRRTFDNLRNEETELEEATAMTMPPKGSLGGSGKKQPMPAPRGPVKGYDAPKGTAKYHNDMAAKHQQAAERHGNMAAEHDDEGNSDKADRHYDRMQHHDSAADAHLHAVSMIKKHGADHPEAQKASKEASKHKLGEAIELDEISKDMLKRYADKAASDAKWAHHDSQTPRRIHWKTREKHFKRYDKRRKGVGSAMKRGIGTDDHVDQIKGRDTFDYTDSKNPNKGDKVKRWKGDWIKRDPKRNSMTGKKAPYKHESVELSEANIAEILRNYALTENISADQLADLTEEEINEIVGKAIGGAFKLGAKAAVGAGRLAIGAGRLAGKAAKRTVMNKQGSVRFTKAAKMDREGNRAEKAAKKAEKERARRDRIQNAKDRIKKARSDLNQAKAKPATP